MKANILVDQTGRARLADFGLLTIVSDGSSISSNSFLWGGTIRWMSPEFDPEKFGLMDSRQTKPSDCHALGMVVYEVLSGRVPFSHHHGPAIIGAIMKGEHPGRPRRDEKGWFTGAVWDVLERCWKPNPGDRPNIEEVLQCLEEVSMAWALLPPLEQALVLTTVSSGWDSDASAEGSTGGDEVSSPSQAASFRPVPGACRVFTASLLSLYNGISGVFWASRKAPKRFLQTVQKPGGPVSEPHHRPSFRQTRLRENLQH